MSDYNDDIDEIDDIPENDIDDIIPENSDNDDIQSVDDTDDDVDDNDTEDVNEVPDDDYDTFYITRDKDEKILTVVKGNKRITQSRMCLEEITKVIGIRATEIDQGAPAYVDITNIKNTIHMALLEVYQRKCPLSIRRHLSLNVVEEWSVNEMELPLGYKKNHPID